MYSIFMVVPVQDICTCLQNILNKIAAVHSQMIVHVFVHRIHGDAFKKLLRQVFKREGCEAGQKTTTYPAGAARLHGREQLHIFVFSQNSSLVIKTKLFHPKLHYRGFSLRGGR